MATKLGMESVVDSAFSTVRYNSVAPRINSDSDFAAQTALTSIRASSADLATRPGGAEISSLFLARSEIVYGGFTQAGSQRAAHRAAPRVVTAAPTVRRTVSPPVLKS